MTKTELLTRFSVDEASRLSLARVLDRAQLAQSRDVPACTQFLTNGERELADQALRAFGDPRRLFWGGHEGAQRAVCVFLPRWAEEPGQVTEGALAAVEAVPTAPGAALSHRDYLGSLMGLGLARECLGDILLTPQGAQVVCLPSVLPALLSQWTEVGRHAVRVRESPLSDLQPVVERGRIRRLTFQSLRLDAVAAAGFGLSRAKAAALIAGGRVLVNHLPCQKPDRLLKEGDDLTARGYGKCVLTQVLGESRKGRILVEMERFQ